MTVYPRRCKNDVLNKWRILGVGDDEEVQHTSISLTTIFILILFTLIVLNAV
jgi:hypothetical protein